MANKGKKFKYENRTFVAAAYPFFSWTLYVHVHKKYVTSI